MPLLKKKTAKVIRNKTYHRLTLDEVTQIVMCCFDKDDNYPIKVTMEQIRSKTRKHHVVLVRQMITYFALLFTPHSLNEIGRHVGEQDHTSVIYSGGAIQHQRETASAQDIDIINKIETEMFYAAKLGICQAEINMLKNMDATQWATLDNLMDSIATTSEIEKIEAQLMKHNISLAAAVLYKGKFTIPVFVKGLNSMYERLLFTSFAVRYLFPTTYKAITEDTYNDHEESGKTYIEIYKHMLEWQKQAYTIVA